MEVKKWYFKTTRKWRDMQDIDFMFYVNGNNILDASANALQRIMKVSQDCANLHNYGYDDMPFEILYGNGIVSMWNVRIEKCIMSFIDVENITADEYINSNCDKAYLNMWYL